MGQLLFAASPHEQLDDAQALVQRAARARATEKIRIRTQMRLTQTKIDRAAACEVEQYARQMSMYESHLARIGVAETQCVRYLLAIQDARAVADHAEFAERVNAVVAEINDA